MLSTITYLVIIKLKISFMQSRSCVAICAQKRENKHLLELDVIFNHLETLKYLIDFSLIRNLRDNKF